MSGFLSPATSRLVIALRYLVECKADVVDAASHVKSESLSFDDPCAWRALLLQLMNEPCDSRDVSADRWSAELVHFFKATFSATLGELCGVSEYSLSCRCY
jgi:hypothetical protein